MKRKKRVLLTISICLLSAVILLLVAFLLFQTRKIEVTGNQYCEEQQLVEWIQSDKMAFNSLYIWLKYNYTNVKKPAAIDKVKVSLKNPWTVRMKVTEKSFLGYFDYEGEFLYFDEQGTAALKTADTIEGAPFIEGLGIEESKVEMNEKLPVSDEGVFDKIVEVTRLLKKYDIDCDRLSGESGHITLFFGPVTVQLGTGEFEKKVAQIPPILEQLNEQFPGREGVLQLENYTGTSQSIRFIPK